MDLEKIRAKLELLKNGGNENSFQKNLWKPNKDGEESQIRIIANPHNEPDDPFSELWFHYNLGMPGIICLKNTFGKVCPICEFGKELYQSGKQSDKDLAKQFFPVARYYAVVVDRVDETLIPKYWAFSKTVYQILLGALLDDDYSNYLDHHEGLDIQVKIVKDPKKLYPDTVVSFRRKESKLAKNKDEINNILESVKPLFDIFKPSTTAEIKERLNKWLAPSEEEEEEVEVKSETIKKSSKKSIDSVDDLFDEIVGE
jgi:hypothetical protein